VETAVDVLGELDRAGAVVLDRHFVLKSGKHSAGYINLDLLFPDALLTSRICALMVDPFRGQFDTVAAPAVGGVALAVLGATAAAHADPAIRAVWADKKGDGFEFERAGFVRHLTGKRVLVLEDFPTTGESVGKVCRLIEAHGGAIIGVSIVCNRGGLSAEALGVPRLEALSEVTLSAVDAAECGLCAARAPIVENVGHGAAYKFNNPGYPGGYVSLAV
jgi:orotate phosphoribosyltransferase